MALKTCRVSFALTNGLKRDALMLSVPGEDKTNHSWEESYKEMLRDLNLTLEAYYAAEKNICNIIIP